MSFFEELKRRNVFRVAIGYAITAWLLLQFVDLVLENVNAPDWVMQVFMLALAIGFPLAVFFAWAFEMTPDGVKRESEVDRSKSITPQTGRRMDRNIIIALVLALAYFAYDKFSGSGESDKASDPVSRNTTQSVETEIAEKLDSTPSQVNSSEKSVAVLPFINMSDDAQNEYFSDGISEELLNVLVKVKGLRVPSRTSSFTFKGSTKKLAEIGEELQVDHILEGSVRKSGDRIRVTAQLVEVNTDTHLWSETYTRQLDDIFEVQDEIAQAIVSALKLTLTGNDQTSIQSRSTVDVEAYNKYLLGRHLWNQRSPESLLAAAKPLNEAVAMDPNYGQAWAALADAYVLIPEYGAGAIDQYIPLAHEATDKALAIDPESARALTTSAYLKFMYDYDFAGAHADFERAISNDPNYATAHQWYGELLAVEGHVEAAVDQLMLARIADPLAFIMPHDIGWFLMFTDRRDEAYAYFEEALRLKPQFQNAIGNMMRLDMITGRYDDARARLSELSTNANLERQVVEAVIDALQDPSLKPNAVRLLVQSEAFNYGSKASSFYLILLDEPDLAMDALEEGFAIGDPRAVHIKRMDVYKPLHTDPRFQKMMKKMNMWP